MPTDAPQEALLLTRHEMAKILRISRGRFDQLIEKGMPHITFGPRSARFNQDEVVDWCRRYHGRNLTVIGRETEVAA